MYRVLCFIFFAELGLAFVGFGLLVPAHLRAVDATHIELAGRSTPSLMAAGLKLVEQEKPGAAQLFLGAASQEPIRDKELLESSIIHFNKSHLNLIPFGGAAPYLQRLFPNNRPLTNQSSLPVIEFVKRPDNQERLFTFLEISQRPVVAEILKIRARTNTVYFPSGQALDTVVVLAGHLLQGDHFSPTLHEEMVKVVLAANSKNDSRELEMVFLDLLSLGARFNWNQFTLFIGRIETLSTLRDLARLARGGDTQLPTLFSSVCFSGQPAAVASYLKAFKENGFQDIAFSLGAGLGGLNVLLAKQQRIHYPSEIRNYVTTYEPFGAFHKTMLGWGLAALPAVLLIKYLFYLCGGFFLARACHYGKRAASALEQPLQVPALAPARQGLWALFFLLVLILLSEPFLAQENRQMDRPLRSPMPKVGAAVPAASINANKSLMTQLSLFSLLLFFVLQALIYTACLIKLSEIRRQNANPRLKLRLLENEEHLFDAGLYLGFVGTIISLILMSMGVVKPSLMAGYSSTSFGIIFVSILKIFHVRPFRRKLILESESQTP
jgi:hypothetical protein